MRALILTALLSSTPALACTSDADLGSALGISVASGNVCGMADDVGASCGLSGSGEELSYTWTAPADGTYQFSTVGSAIDTVLSMESSACSPIGCNDDAFLDAVVPQSVLTVTLNAGEVVHPSVHGYAPACGDIILSITDATVADLDADGVDDGSDQCLGSDLLGDSDGDGLCDDRDECLGDDASGNNDDDDVCDDLDFVLTQTDVVPGSPMTFTASNAPAGARVFFLVSNNLNFGPPLCHPTATDVCTILETPTVLGTVMADAAGTAELTVTVPAGLPNGFLVVSEAAWFQGGTGDATGFYINAAL